MMEDRTQPVDTRATAVRLQSTPRPYSEPKLTHIGSISEITGGPSGGTIDTLTGGSGGFQTSTS